MASTNRPLYYLQSREDSDGIWSLKNLLFIASGVLLTDTVVSSRFTALVGFTLAMLAGLYLAFQHSTNKVLNRSLRWAKRHRVALSLPLFTLIGCAYLLDSFADPAAAQFLQNTQAWMQTAFPVAGGGAAGTDLYALIFNVLRAIFVIYLAISLVRVIAAARNDEDWQTLARTPLIILITVTLGDILAGFITGA